LCIKNVFRLNEKKIIETQKTTVAQRELDQLNAIKRIIASQSPKEGGRGTAQVKVQPAQKPVKPETNWPLKVQAPKKAPSMNYMVSHLTSPVKRENGSGHIPVIINNKSSFTGNSGAKQEAVNHSRILPQPHNGCPAVHSGYQFINNSSGQIMSPGSNLPVSQQPTHRTGSTSSSSSTSSNPSPKIQHQKIYEMPNSNRGVTSNNGHQDSTGQQLLYTQVNNPQIHQTFIAPSLSRFGIGKLI
jgi:hypothetical protein